jgi:hypothetical protein
LSKGRSNAKWVYAYLHVGGRLPVLKTIKVVSATTESELRGKALAAETAGIEESKVLCFPSGLEYDCYKVLVNAFGFDNVARHVKLTLSEEWNLYWVIDFWVKLPSGQFLAVEAKGVETAEFKRQFAAYTRIRDLHPGRLPRLIIARSVKSLREQLAANELIPKQTVLL